jgi:hypothetical protein
MVASKMGLLPCLLGASQLVQWSLALPTEQLPLQVQPVAHSKHNAVQATEQRPLHGRFLHMTGMRVEIGEAIRTAQTN